jgi:hypothetical protein
MIFENFDAFNSSASIDAAKHFKKRLKDAYRFLQETPYSG